MFDAGKSCKFGPEVGHETAISVGFDVVGESEAFEPVVVEYSSCLDGGGVEVERSKYGVSC